MVIYMFLKKCDRATEDEYHVISAALAQEMAASGAPDRLRYDIQTSAQGSFQEVYAASACEGSDADALYIQYNDYIRALSGQQPAP